MFWIFEWSWLSFLRKFYFQGAKLISSETRNTKHIFLSTLLYTINRRSWFNQTTHNVHHSIYIISKFSFCHLRTKFLLKLPSSLRILHIAKTFHHFKLQWLKLFAFFRHFFDTNRNTDSHGANFISGINFTNSNF